MLDRPARPGHRTRPARLAGRVGAGPARHRQTKPVAPGLPVPQPGFRGEAREVDPPPQGPPVPWRWLPSHRVERAAPARGSTPRSRRRGGSKRLFRPIQSTGVDLECGSLDPASFRTRCTMTRGAGGSGRPRGQARARLAAPAAPRLTARPQSRPPIHKARGPAPPGPATLANPAPAVGSPASPKSALYNAATDSNTMWESDSPRGEGGPARGRPTPLPTPRPSATVSPPSRLRACSPALPGASASAAMPPHSTNPAPAPNATAIRSNPADASHPDPTEKHYPSVPAYTGFLLSCGCHECRFCLGPVHTHVDDSA